MGKVLVSRQFPKVDMVEVLSGRMGTSNHEDLGRQMAQQSFSHRLRPLMAQPNPVLSVNHFSNHCAISVFVRVVVAPAPTKDNAHARTGIAY